MPPEPHAVCEDVQRIDRPPQYPIPNPEPLRPSIIDSLKKLPNPNIQYPTSNIQSPIPAHKSRTTQSSIIVSLKKAANPDTNLLPYQSITPTACPCAG